MLICALVGSGNVDGTLRWRGTGVGGDVGGGGRKGKGIQETIKQEERNTFRRKGLS